MSGQAVSVPPPCQSRPCRPAPVSVEEAGIVTGAEHAEQRRQEVIVSAGDTVRQAVDLSVAETSSQAEKRQRT